MAKGWFINFLPVLLFPRLSQSSDGDVLWAGTACCFRGTNSKVSSLVRPEASWSFTRFTRSLCWGCFLRAFRLRWWNIEICRSDFIRYSPNLLSWIQSGSGPSALVRPGPFGSFSWEARAAGNLSIYITASLKPWTLLSCDPNVTTCCWLHLSTQCKALVGAPARSYAGPVLTSVVCFFCFFNNKLFPANLQKLKVEMS